MLRHNKPQPAVPAQGRTTRHDPFKIDAIAPPPDKKTQQQARSAAGTKAKRGGAHKNSLKGFAATGGVQSRLSMFEQGPADSGC